MNNVTAGPASAPFLIYLQICLMKSCSRFPHTQRTGICPDFFIQENTGPASPMPLNNLNAVRSRASYQWKKAFLCWTGQKKRIHSVLPDSADSTETYHDQSESGSHAASRCQSEFNYFILK